MSSAELGSSLRIYQSQGRYLVWEPRHIFALRCTHRIVGSLIGPMPGKSRQAAESGPPLTLLFEEALLATEEEFAQVVDGRIPTQVQPNAISANEPSAERSKTQGTITCATTGAASEPSAVGKRTADGTCRESASLEAR